MIRLTSLFAIAFATVSCITPPPMDSQGPSQPAGQPAQGGAPQEPAQGAQVPPPPKSNEPVPYNQRPFATEAGLVFGRNSAWITSRTNVGRHSLVDAGIYFSDDETIFNAGILQIARSNPDSPLSIGAGFSFYGGTLRGPLDDFSAITIAGIAKYKIHTAFPGVAKFQVNYAPEATAFGDADELIDLNLMFEVQLANAAAIMVGYRWFEVGITDNFGIKLQDSAIIGVRLGF